ncbi:hypothetical protein UY3_11895 [Chelonia mydas]|uniref:Uncharacterized protein n=1 Tax=Chelonia mydas TaxID=8469 RepID=M7BSA7_CHEMY|nr:hypothetical protein UY3_11895 [Chelonia mydas]
MRLYRYRPSPAPSPSTQLHFLGSVLPRLEDRAVDGTAMPEELLAWGRPAFCSFCLKSVSSAAGGQSPRPGHIETTKLRRHTTAAVITLLLRVHTMLLVSAVHVLTWSTCTDCTVTVRHCGTAFESHNSRCKQRSDYTDTASTSLHRH